LKEICIQAAEQAFAQLKSEGVTLSELGRQKFDQYASINIEDLSNMPDMRLPATWRAFYNRLEYLDLFGPQDRIITRTFGTTKGPSFEERLASINSDTRDGLEAAVRLVQEQVHEDWHQTFLGWERVLYEKLKVTLTREQKIAAVNIMRELNLNMLDHRSYDKARFEMFRRGIVGQDFLEPLEVLDLVTMPAWTKANPTASPEAYRYHYRMLENQLRHGVKR
jgi:hypothetical protein